MTYFKSVNTLEELRKQYKELLKKYHPDCPQGSTEATQQINGEYERLFKLLKDKHTTSQQQANENRNQKQSYYNENMYDWENDKALRQMLEKIINFKDIEIEIIGQWILIFNSYNYRKYLKEFGFKYSPNKKAWYYHTEAFRKQSKKKLSLDAIRNYYGSTRVYSNSRELLEA